MPESFLARQAAQKAKGINGNGMGLPLTMAAKLWPTATAADSRASTNTTSERSAEANPRHGEDTLTDAVSARDWKGANQGEPHGGNARPLNEVAVLWSTPRAWDCEGGPDLNKAERSSTGPTLRTQAALWSTPSVGDVTGGHVSRSGERMGEALLNGQTTSLSSHLDRTHWLTGDPYSPERRSLNPLFVEWLMGWPQGWTMLAAGPGSTGCASSATAFSRWRARMAFALSQLASPPAPPAQLSLFE